MQKLIMMREDVPSDLVTLVMQLMNSQRSDMAKIVNSMSSAHSTKDNEIKYL